MRTYWFYGAAIKPYDCGACVVAAGCTQQPLRPLLGAGREVNLDFALLSTAMFCCPSIGRSGQHRCTDSSMFNGLFWVKTFVNTKQIFLWKERKKEKTVRVECGGKQENLITSSSFFSCRDWFIVDGVVCECGGSSILDRWQRFLNPIRPPFAR